jgi:uncharacterized protein (DUF1501 family)
MNRLNRRQFLQQSGLFAASNLITIGLHGWVLPGLAATAQRQRLVVVFLRGAVDGLNVVIPYQESAYYTARPWIAIPQPGKTEGALDLDGQFGLHPALAMLMPLWQQGKLAFVHACGSPDPTRSHFDAQDYMESGTPGVKRTADGWMNRLLTGLPSSTRRSPLQAVNIGAATPRILLGKAVVANIASGQAATRALPLDRPQVQSAFDRLYQGQDALSQAYREGQQARQQLLADLNTPDVNAEMQAANRGTAPAGRGFVRDAQRLGRLINRDPSIQLGFLAVGGWDTHVNQGGSTGQLAARLRSLGQGLTALAQGLGQRFAETTIVVISEFGRTVRENGNAGTDHGHGNVIWLLGDKVQGRQVHGQWPGLAPDRLFEGRDLAITTDFREVMATVLVKHLQLDTSKVSQVFPGYNQGRSGTTLLQTL